MTEKLFYKDSHLSKFDAEVLSCVRAKRQQVKDSFGRLDGKAGEYYEIELDRTAFFPEGGGQYADTGVLYMADDDTCGLDETARKKVQVLDVRERNGRIFHITDGFIEAKTAVKGSIDWEERFMKMQQHTGEHIVSGLIHAAYGYNNVGFHLGSEDCTMDFDGEITEEELRRIEAEANKAVWKNLKVFTHYPKKEELSQIEYRSKIEIEGQVRIIEIPGYDCCACCAPHVTYTGEIGLIKLVGMQRYKGGVRVTMLCGGRAMADYALKQKQAKEISAMLCAKENELTDAVAHLQKELAEKKTELAEKEQELIRCKAEQIPESEQIVCIFPEGIQGDSLRILMNAVLEKNRKLCAVFSGNDAAGYRYVIGSRDVDVRNMAKELNAAFEGRGGGRPEMVQGTVRGTEEELQNWVLRKAEEL